MNKIELLVNDENLEIIKTILDNLRDGIISEMKLNEKPAKIKHTRYQPKTNKVIYENESATNDSSGKYASLSTYKQRLKK